MLAAHRRWGLAVPAGMAAAAALVSVAVTSPRLHMVGYANYLLVWGSIYQWGLAWADGTPRPAPGGAHRRWPSAVRPCWPGW
jgi:hypothetical protein